MTAEHRAPVDEAIRAAIGRPKYRIAFIGGRGVGGTYSGVETFYEEVGSRLAARGHRVTVYCRPSFTPSDTMYRGMHIRMLRAPRSKHFETLFHSAASTVDALFRPYDIVHYHAIGSSVFAWLPRLRATRTVVTIHALDGQRPKWNWIARNCLRLAEWTSVLLPTRTTAVSRAVASHFHKDVAAKIAVIPNGVAVRPQPSLGVLNELNLKPQEYVLFVGRLSEEKRCHLLIEAMRLTNSDLPLVIAGGATYASEYEAKLNKQADSRVRFLGWMDQEKLAALYAGCALYVLPSSLEGMSVALLEAMGNGAPVLVSDIAPNLEAIGDAGWSFRTDDVHHLAQQLLYLLSSPRLLRQGAEAARQRVAEHFSWDTVVDRIERVYGSMFTSSNTVSAMIDARR